MAEFRRAESLAKLLQQVNAAAPNREKDSDGWIGDAAHRARPSDHNPNGAGVVCAIDITHDPARGFDSYKFAELLRKNRDPRINYVISNGRIFSSTVGDWEWRRYTGSNPHNHHVHISVSQNKARYDDPHEWKIKPGEDAPKWDDGRTSPPSGEKRNPVLRRGSLDNVHVMYLQAALGMKGKDLDGFFGPKTETLVKDFQKTNGFTVDGVVGPQTWDGLMKNKPIPVK